MAGTLPGSELRCSHGRECPGISQAAPGLSALLWFPLPVFTPMIPVSLGSQHNPMEAEQTPVPVSPPCPQHVPTPVSPRRGLPRAPARSGSCPTPRGAAAGHFAQPHFLPLCQRDSPASFPTPRGGGSHFGPAGDGGEAVTFPQLQGHRGHPASAHRRPRRRSSGVSPAPAVGMFPAGCGARFQRDPAAGASRTHSASPCRWCRAPRRPSRGGSAGSSRSAGSS